MSGHNSVRELGELKTLGSVAVVTSYSGRSGKSYRNPMEHDFKGNKRVREALRRLETESVNDLPILPNELSPPKRIGVPFQKYGIVCWRDLYTDRQLLALSTFTKLIGSQQLRKSILSSGTPPKLVDIVLTCLSLALGRVNDLSASLCRWLPSIDAIAATNGGQNKMPIILDFAEANPIGGSGGDWDGQTAWIIRVIENIVNSSIKTSCQIEHCAAQDQLLPNDISSAMITDPPYYDAFGYSDLSEFFHIWLRRAVPSGVYSYKYDKPPKKNEAITIGKSLDDNRGAKTDETYQIAMTQSFLKLKEP